MRDAALRQKRHIRTVLWRWQDGHFVVPAKAGTHTPCPTLGHAGRRLLRQLGPVFMGPCFRRDDDHTAILRCRTGPPAVSDSAASVMALPSLPCSPSPSSTTPSRPNSPP